MLGIILVLLFCATFVSSAPVVNVTTISKEVRLILDGRLTEPFWREARGIDNLVMVEPVQGKEPTFPTTVRVVATEEKLILGIFCYDSNPDRIIAYSKAHDSRLRREDHIKLVFDTFLDGRTGYVFAVNPIGARYDALVSRYGEGENPRWDCYWEAEVALSDSGWSCEIVIPIYSLNFKKDSREWGFNVERRIERFLELDRWTGARQDYRITHVIHAGRIANLPQFRMGKGLIPTFSLVSDISRARSESSDLNSDLSLDILKKFGPDVTAQLTVNTDFAETEVDARRTNLTRFPLFFPEKRRFFLEGADIFDFGIGLRHDLIPFFSRRIGLYEGREIPILAGLKLNGKVSGTNFGALITATDEVDTLVPRKAMGVIRVKRNILRESSVGFLTTFGDPAATGEAWLFGVDLIYQTSQFLGDKNFLIGAWNLINQPPHDNKKQWAHGFKIDYPNDVLDMSFTYKFVDKDFSPSLGFVRRTGFHSYRLSADFMPRPDNQYIRQFFFESSFSMVTDLKHRWESYYVFLAPVHFLLESGDRFEFNVIPNGERLVEDFEISDGVVLKPGEYEWLKYRLELETASKRPLNGQFTWWFGGFYDGKIDQFEVRLSYRINDLIIIGVNHEQDLVRLPEGNFNTEILRTRISFNLTPDFQISSFIQYDNESSSLGANTRLWWRFSLLGNLYIVYNHNVLNVNRDEYRNWLYDSNQLIIKVSYGLFI